MVFHHVPQLSREALFILQISQTQPSSAGLILIGRPNTATSGANFFVATLGLASLIESHMVGQD